MEPYRPFLLPLLAGRTDFIGPPEGSAVPVCSPLDEEQQIADLPGHPHVLWEQLQERIPDVYGLPLILEWHHRFKRPGEVGEIRGDVGRFLRLEGPAGSWFLIEHPSAVYLFDLFAGDADQVALAKPSLFARLWRESEFTQGTPVHVEEATDTETDDDRLALQTYIERLVKAGNPSDWHLEPRRRGFLSRLRLHGKLGNPEILSPEKGVWLQNSLRTQAGIEESGFHQACEGRLAFSCRDNSFTLRLSFVPVLYGQAMVGRFLYPADNRSQDLSNLGLSPGQKEWILDQYAQSEGLWLVVGPTGSGKTTSLHALIAESVRQNEKILTAEDPVEKLIAGTQQVSLDSERGLTYARVMRAFLRQAPDTILIGEIRDEETAAIAAQAGRTGHRVLSTLHARSDSGVLRRLEDLGQDPSSIQPLLKLVLHQRLLPRVCHRCRSWFPVPAGLRDAFETSALKLPATLARVVGCPACQSGYDGRCALFSSGRFLGKPDVQWQLLKSAWPLICDGTLALRDCLPLIPDGLPSLFQLCHS